MTDLEPIIRRQHFFSELPDEHIRLLTSCASNVRFDPGQVIFQAGVKADQFFLIRRGLVSLELPIQGKETITIQTVSSGEILGWSWLFPPYEPYFDARATDPVLAIGFDGECIRQECDANSALGYLLMKLFAQVFRERLRGSQLQLLDLYETPVAAG